MADGCPGWYRQAGTITWRRDVKTRMRRPAREQLEKQGTGKLVRRTQQKVMRTSQPTRKVATVTMA